VHLLTFNRFNPSALARAMFMLVGLVTGIISVDVWAASGGTGNDNYVNVGSVPIVDFGTWTSGSLSTTINSCIASANEKDANPPSPPAQVYPYQASVENRNSGSGFYLYLNNDAANTGNSRITIEFEHRDTVSGTAFESLSEGVYDSHYHLGRFKNCLVTGNNSELRVSIPAANLINKVPGDYRGQFKLHAIGGTSGTKQHRKSFDVELTVQTANVRISGLDDMSFGTYVPDLGNVQLDEHFCVQSLANNAGYRISVSSSNQDASGNFRLGNASATHFIPVDIFFAATGSGSGTQEVTDNAISALGSPLTLCGGANNATISVQALQSDIVASPSGTYDDTLVVLVVPE
jgi:hypothetical protein